MKLTLRKILLLAAAFVGVLVFVFSFVAAYRVTGGNSWFEYQSVIWGSGRINYSDGSASILANDNRYPALVLPLIGAILVILSAICLCAVAFAGDKLVKDKKMRMIIVLVAGGLLVLGGVFMFFAPGQFVKAYATKNDISVENVDAAWKTALLSSTISKSCALPVVSGILAILGGGAAVVSQFVKE